MNFFTFLENKIKYFTGHERSVKTKLNIIALFFVKGYSVIINLLLIPLTLEVLGSYKYGVWITIFNVLTWIEVFDIGLGNGLRNKFSESIAKGNIKESKEYVSTAYIIMIFLSIILLLVFYIPWSYIDWAYIFNVNVDLKEDVKNLIIILFSIVVVQFALKLINSILLALHKPAYPAFVISVSYTIVYLVFVVFKNELNENLLMIGVVYTIVPLIILIIFSLWMFNTHFKQFRPSFLNFRKDKIKSLFSLGSKFFIIQIAGVIIFQTDALIISHKLSPLEVTPYNIVFRYFGVLTMFSTLILTPLWSSYTEAYIQKDFVWIRSIVKKQLIALLISVPLLVLMIFFGKDIINTWIGSEVEISSSLLIAFSFYTFFSLLTGVFSMILGGISKVRLVMYMTFFTMVLNIPLSLFFIEYFGNKSFGVIIATAICLGITAIGNAFQVKYFIFSKKKSPLLDKILQ